MLANYGHPPPLGLSLLCATLSMGQRRATRSILRGLDLDYRSLVYSLWTTFCHILRHAHALGGFFSSSMSLPPIKCLKALKNQHCYIYRKLFKIPSWELHGKFYHYWGNPGTRNSFFGLILGSSCFPASYKWVFIGKYTMLSLVSQFWENTVNVYPCYSQNWEEKGNISQSYSQT